MAFDVALAERVRGCFLRLRNIEELFGCVCFLLNGNAPAGVWKDRLVACVGPAEGERRCGNRTSGRSRLPSRCRTRTRPACARMNSARAVGVRSGVLVQPVANTWRGVSSFGLSRTATGSDSRPVVGHHRGTGGVRTSEQWVSNVGNQFRIPVRRVTVDQIPSMLTPPPGTGSSNPPRTAPLSGSRYWTWGVALRVINTRSAAPPPAALARAIA